MVASIAKRIAGTVGLAALSVALSSLFRHELGAPNYGLGVVVGVTLTCYFFGLTAAVLGLVLAIVGDYLFLIEAVRFSAMPRLIAIILTVSVTCALVVLLQNARRVVSRHNDELREAHEQLGKAFRYEKNIASTLQRAFLPAVPSRFGDVSIAAIYEAGSKEAQIGGDFYDVLRLNENQLLIALGDVSGKGIEAARQAAGARYGLRSCILETMSPAEALRRLNDMLLLDPQFDGFATLFVGILDVAAGKITYCNGGHEPPILYRQATGEHIELRTSGMILGALPTSDFAEDEITFRECDVVLLYTDGLSEARHNNEMLGSEGLSRALVDAVSDDVSEYLDKIAAIARDYAGGEFRDDVAAVLLSIHRAVSACGS